MNAPVPLLQRQIRSAKRAAMVRLRRAKILSATGPMRTEPVSFIVDGKPKGKARARVTRFGTYTPSGTVAYEGKVRGEARVAMKNHQPFDGPVLVEIRAVLPVAKSWSNKKRVAALDGTMLPTSKPDCDNIAKLACDALNHTVWNDDSQVTGLSVSKVYGSAPHLSISIKPILTQGNHHGEATESIPSSSGCTSDRLQDQDHGVIVRS